MVLLIQKESKSNILFTAMSKYNIKHCACINFRKVMSDHHEKVEKLTNTIAQFK